MAPTAAGALGGKGELTPDIGASLPSWQDYLQHGQVGTKQVTLGRKPYCPFRRKDRGGHRVSGAQSWRWIRRAAWLLLDGPKSCSWDGRGAFRVGVGEGWGGGWEAESKYLPPLSSSPLLSSQGIGQSSWETCPHGGLGDSVCAASPSRAQSKREKGGEWVGSGDSALFLKCALKSYGQIPRWGRMCLPDRWTMGNLFLPKPQLALGGYGNTVWTEVWDSPWRACSLYLFIYPCPSIICLSVCLPVRHLSIPAHPSMSMHVHACPCMCIVAIVCCILCVEICNQ